MTSRQDLVKIKLRAIRAKVWFKALSKVERSVIDLTIKCVEKIRSNILSRAISTILHKILQSLEEGFNTRAERIGYEIAQNLCILAERWGNKTSPAWKHDKHFIKYLGVTALNT